MKFIIDIIKNIIIIPYTILSKAFSIFYKNKTPVQSDVVVNDNNSNLKYYISFAIWVLVGYFLFGSLIKYNRIVYACPADYSRPCSYVEAEFHTICDKVNGCFRYYSKIIFPNRKTIKFSYCDMKGIAVYDCFTEEKQESWRLEYLGRRVLQNDQEE